MTRLITFFVLLVLAPSAFTREGATVVETPAQPVATDIFARDTFRIDSFVCPFKGDIDYEPGEIQCGLLQVPENREKPDSRFIELHFVKLNSTWDDEDEEEPDQDDDADWTKPAPGKRDDPVIYLSGGPGSHATYYVKRFKDHGILEHRDMYILEQRGVGYSDDFCPEYAGRAPGKFDVQNYEQQQQATLQASDDCRINALAAGVDLSGYNTIENARDVHALRRALDIDQWNVWGISYGTILGQAYLRQDPHGIRAIVLDSIVPINAQDEAHYWQVVKWYDRDLKKLDALCQAQPGCARRYPDLGQRLRQATTTVIGNPITVEVRDTEIFPSGQARIFQDIAAFLPFVMLYEQTNYPGLPAMIYAWTDVIESRDETFFEGLAAAAGGGFFGGGSQGMYDAIFCLDGYREAQIQASAADRAEFPIFGSVLGSQEIDRTIAQRCHELGMPPRDYAEYAPVVTDIPALIVAGDMDPITPPPLAKAILPGFSNATYVEFPFAGHGPLRSVECGGDLLNLFYDNPGSEPDLSCVEQMEAPEFHALFRTAIAPRMMVLAAEDKKKLALPAAWAGVSVFVSVIAFILLTLAPVGRFIDKRQPVAVAGARWFAWLAAAAATIAVVIIGAATAVTVNESELLGLFGLVPWARFGAIAGVLAGLFGIAAIVQTIRARRTRPLPIGTLIGFIITGVAGLALSAFLLYWDLGPL